MNPRLKVRAGPDGLHFFNRINGVNILVDEITPPLDTWAVAPRQVSIALTNSCDLACPHCYAPKYPSSLSFENLTHWLTELDVNGCMCVGFGGGEPTLYPQLLDICSYANKKTNMAITVTTHGHNLNDQLLNGLKENVQFIRVSMDGFGYTYESIRCRSFKVLIERIVSLGRLMRFGINYLVNSMTIGDIDAALQLASVLGASEFLLIPERREGKESGIDEITETCLQRWINNYNGKVPLAISENGIEGIPLCNPFRSETGLTAFAHINASGILKRTSFDPVGVPIQNDGVIAALDKLNQEAIQ